jgi:glycosyltransferase involved in cell wall biosynthesis
VQARASAHAIEHGVTGLLFEEGHSGALAGAIVQLLHQPGLGAALGRRAQRVARARYDAGSQARTLAAIYGQLTAVARRLQADRAGVETPSGIGVRGDAWG